MADRIKVLIVDDNEETRDGTQRLLEYEDNIEIVGFAENGLVAIEQVKELDPDVVLMDINMPVMDGLTATQQLKHEAPRTQVIIVSVQDDAHYLKEAFRAGAADFVAKPITSAELAQAIERAYQRIPETPVRPEAGPAPAPPPGYQVPRPLHQGHVIGVLGPKGGVGKTLVAVNLGVGMAQAARDKKVLIVDGNLFFGDIGVFLNTRGQYSVADVAVMTGEPEGLDAESLEGVVVPHESGVKLLVAPPNPADVPSVSSEMMVKLFNFLKTQYDYVIVDTAPSFDDVLVAAIRAADRLVVVTTPTMPALKDTRILFSELAAAEYEMEHILLLLNQVAANNRITAEQIGNFLGRPVALEIPLDPLADETVNRGAPLIKQDARRAPAVRPLAELVQMVRQSIEAVPEAAEETLSEESHPKRGLFGLLGRS
ncbi:MAG TPA: CobQ/CobB/MinD/ParA nucleotide binding domain-containing protein [Chloroflexi bacterium]|nr:CobQ/CobB/MinD/ParA nucleotide binding domain-containing protein [Chloroflexota bacterium]